MDRRVPSREGGAAAGRVRLLLVEDDVVDQQAFRRTVAERRLPYECAVAGTVGEARALLARQRFDVIVADHTLGDGTCFELFGCAAGAPIIITTGSGDEVRAVRAMREGAADYLIKDRAGTYLDMLPVTVERVLARRRIEDERARLFVELQRSNAELDQFAAVASHDLQEPLRGVTGFLELLVRRYGDRLDRDGREFVDLALSEALRLQRMIRDLLAYARVTTGARPFGPTDCEAVLRDALGSLRAAIEDSGATVTHDALPAVEADPAQLTQLFLNLIDNAIKYRGEAPPCIHVSARRSPVVGRRSSAERPPTGDVWLFSVRDNGTGIDPALVDQAFVLFRRLHRRADCPGTGIGLAVCKKIVERHGGRIWVESAVGQGSTFFFTLPARSEAPGVLSSQERMEVRR